MSTAAWIAYPIDGAHPVRSQAGFGLIELMISLAIASVLVLGLVVVAGNTQRTYSSQTDLAAINDKERFAAELLNSAVQTAGYFTTPAAPITSATLKTMNAMFPAEAGTFNAGQVLGGQTAGAGAGGDTLNVRFTANTGDTVAPQNCQGGSAGGLVAESMFEVVSNNLVCKVSSTSGGAPGNQIVLIDGVSSMTVLYGVDLSGISNNVSGTNVPGSVTEYATAANVTAMGAWKLVRSVMIQLQFTSATSPSLPPQTYTQIIQVMYETVAS